MRPFFPFHFLRNKSKARNPKFETKSNNRNEPISGWVQKIRISIFPSFPPLNFGHSNFEFMKFHSASDRHPPVILFKKRSTGPQTKRPPDPMAPGRTALRFAVRCHAQQGAAFV
jgi:hypothetical protein